MRDPRALAAFIFVTALVGQAIAAPPAPPADAKAVNPVLAADEPIYLEDARCRTADPKVVSALDSGYPCCTKCTNCRLECVATDASGNCTRWKYNCDCERWCPCPRSR